jgi:hypothetical protein
MRPSKGMGRIDLADQAPASAAIAASDVGVAQDDRNSSPPTRASHVHGAQVAAEDLRHLRQDVVAGGVAHGVVHLLEEIEVEMQEREVGLRVVEQAAAARYPSRAGSPVASADRSAPRALRPRARRSGGRSAGATGAIWRRSPPAGRAVQPSGRRARNPDTSGRNASRRARSSGPSDTSISAPPSGHRHQNTAQGQIVGAAQHKRQAFTRAVASSSSNRSRPQGGASRSRHRPDKPRSGPRPAIFDSVGPAWRMRASARQKMHGQEPVEQARRHHASAAIAANDGAFIPRSDRGRRPFPR